MPIPESHLSRWSDHGAQDASKRTHEAIRTVLRTHRWSPGMTCDLYLQGSYRNDTNIRGDSDVDMVLELQSTTMRDVGSLSSFEQEMVAASLGPVTYDWNDFRRETLKALEGGFGKKMVAQGNKTIKLKADPPRLAADLVVCMEHRRYANTFTYVQGITFWALHDKRWVINYPQEHNKNGAAKGARTADRYKRTVRMFKNARNHLESIGKIRSAVAPSYFLECLIYNAPDSSFQPSFQETYFSIVNWMIQSSLDGLVCQNGQQWLFGPSPEQWSVTNAKALANQLVSLWNDWG